MKCKFKSINGYNLFMITINNNLKPIEGNIHKP